MSQRQQNKNIQRHGSSFLSLPLPLVVKFIKFRYENNIIYVKIIYDSSVSAHNLKY